MSGAPKTPPGAGSCPFCGVATRVPHESQEGCIAALQEEIGRMRGLLANTSSGGERDDDSADAAHRSSHEMTKNDRT